jgi:hypothetical protein
MTKIGESLQKLHVVCYLMLLRKSSLLVKTRLPDEVCLERIRDLGLFGCSLVLPVTSFDSCIIDCQRKK